ncbi:MAG: protein-disulfide reductase DsbD [Betaproteobacteria bacterium AqS2]|uniref:Protein-disulfide reductase DsbD n=1 Tax=Candidatus Amphirhobacter heronislandensis TaxID=1732024 RepID=A0A930UHJ7_9GAMM|nr:protein-disulfide reductase DsbD [Betaproteobacteria bacterium AqS2]
MPAFAARLALLLLAPLAASQAQVAGPGLELLPQDEAFRISAGATPAAFAFTVAIHEGYYLYRDRTALRLADGTTLALALPPGEMVEDEFFGRVETFRGELAFSAARPAAAGAEQVAELVIQGCADAGVCYPPYAVSIAFAAAGPGELRGDNLGRYAAAPEPLSNTAELVAALDGSPLPLVLLLFFNAGLLLSFTPCVLPLVPLALAVSAGRGASRRRALALGVAYVLSMALVYAGLGVLAATAGRTALAAWLQTPWLLVPLALLFAFLGGAMIAELRLRLLPVGLGQRLEELRGEAGTWRGAAGAGVVGAVVVSPCVAAPLAGALLFIAATGDVATGGLALFALALGMGVLPLACAAGAGRFIPRAGPASVVVRRLGGLLLLGLGVWVLGGLLPAHVKMLAYAALALAACWWLGRLLHGGLQSWAARGLAGALLAAFLGFGGVMAVGGATGGSNELAPLAHLREGPPLAFSTVATMRAYNEGVRAGAGRPTLEYYTADWCVTCVEIDAYVFGDPEVRAELAAYRLVKIDVTASGSEARRLLGINRLFGPPAVVVRSPSGAKLLQFAGSVDRDELLAGLRRIAARPAA